MKKERRTWDSAQRSTKTDELSSWEAEALIKWFMERIGQGERHELMGDLPKIYNKLVGFEVARTTVIRADMSK